MRRKFILISVLGLFASLSLGWSSRSQATLARKLRVTATCVLRYTTATNCVDIKNEFFQQQTNNVERVDSGKNVDLEFKITDEQPDANHLVYTYTWVSHVPNMASGPFPFPPLTLSAGLDQVSTLTKLRDYATKGFLIYLDVISDEPSGDSTTVVFKLPNDDPSSPVKPGFFDRLSKSPFYLNFSVQGSDSSSGNTGNNISSEAFPESVEVAYLKDKFKIDLSGVVAFSKITEPDGKGGTISGSSTSKVFTGFGVYSLSKRWNVAYINTSVINPAGNIKLENVAQAGVEWILVPFRTTENRELAFRVGPQFSTLDLVTPNSLNHSTEKYLGAFAQIYVYWVTMRDKLIFGASATGTENAKYTNYYQGLLSGAATYQVNKIIGFTGQFNYLITPQSITFPDNPNYSNPLQAGFLSGQPGVSKSVTFTMNFTIGNRLRHVRDRRWNTSLSGN